MSAALLSTATLLDFLDLCCGLRGTGMRLDKRSCPAYRWPQWITPLSPTMFGAQVLAIKVLLDHVEDMDRAHEYATKVDEPEVWSELAHVELDREHGVPGHRQLPARRRRLQARLQDACNRAGLSTAALLLLARDQREHTGHVACACICGSALLLATFVCMKLDASAQRGRQGAVACLASSACR